MACTPGDPAMLAKEGITSLVNCGPKEVELARTVTGASGKTAKPIACTISQLVALLRKAMENPEVTVATVCGGSLALAMGGLLEGRNAVTHHLGVDLLEATGATVVNARVVDDGDLVTSGAVTSGLDLALHLLDRTYGAQVALAVEELFAYERRGTVWTQ